MVKQMLTWDSRLSLWTDIILGVLPALIFGYLSIIGLSVTVPEIQDWLSGENRRVMLGPEFFFMSLFGLLACYSIVHVTSTRDRTRPKWLFVLLLSIGILIGSRALPVSLSLIAIAIKHMYLLTRA
jgi:predicted membrane channel-forming protein YqfA (hemolysin III family)